MNYHREMIKRQLEDEVIIFESDLSRRNGQLAESQ